jgi:hydroxyethylthiazole kinase-like uncharacterized protein yjeF
MGLPLFSIETLRKAEIAAATPLAPGALMQRAGAAAARAIARRLGTERRSVAVICGAGNNGGDGYVCAAELSRQGHDVECVALAAPSTDDARAAAAGWQAGGGSVRNEIGKGRAYDAVVDAIFGIGLSRAPRGAFADAIDWINTQTKSLRVALDVPSGLDADRGTWIGSRPGVSADLTVTFLGAKPGLFTGVGCDAAGEVLVESLGVEAGSTQIVLLEPSDFEPVRVPRVRNSHKGDYGNVSVVGGGAGMVGAPLLAARAALRMGAGRVFVDCIGAPALQFDPLHPELMFRSVKTLERIDAAVVGCGLGTDANARTALQWALGAPCPVVFDADALNMLARDGSLRALLVERGHPSILTPHPLEAARLLDLTAAEVQNDRVGHARRLAQELRALIVLKGAGTVVAQADACAWINPTGGPALATPGSGDVLAGMIGALLAQQFSPATSTLAAVWLHGSAANRFGGDIGLVAGEIASYAARCLSDLRQGKSG